jgi:hypothetical protein
MNVTDEVKLIGPGYKKEYDNIRGGYWTPLLAEWSDISGFVEKRDLQEYVYDSTGVKVIGASVNASPLICITKSHIGQEDLTVSVTGYLGLVDSGQSVTTGGVTITGFSENVQYGKKIYRREYVTGGNFQDSFTIPAYTSIGTVFKLPHKRVYRVTDVNVSPRQAEQPLTELGFYALADNGSRLLYSTN